MDLEPLKQAVSVIFLIVIAGILTAAGARAVFWLWP